MHVNKYLFVLTATFMFYSGKNNLPVLCYTLALGYLLPPSYLCPSPCCFPFQFMPVFSFKLFRAGSVLGGTFRVLVPG